MNKKFIIQNNFEFNSIIQTSEYKKDKNIVIYYRKNDYSYSRFGISVGSKIGHAVERNRLKRQIRNILSKNKLGYQNSLDYIIIVRKNCKTSSFIEIENSVLTLLKKIDCGNKGDKDEKDKKS